MTRPGAKLRPALAEAVGTFALVFAGCGAIMVSERFPGSVAPGAVAVVFGLVVAAMIYAVGHISGAHFNPAVTLGFAVVGRFPKKDVALYWAAQFLGALAAIGALDLLLPKGAGFGATVPAVPALAALGWEAVLTFFLMFVIIAVATDTRAHGPVAGIAIGATVCLDAFFGGPVTGASMNPARSLAPALFQGQGAVVWVYFVGPAVGAVAAAFTYEGLR
jgi:MIP family channel proteins